MTALSEKQKKHLRRLAHPLSPIVMLGNAGLTAGVVQEMDRALSDHELVKVSDVLTCDAQTARLYGDVKNGLREKGRPIPENDVWIATIALQHGLVLVSRDGHFDEIDHLLREVW